MSSLGEDERSLVSIVLREVLLGPSLMDRGTGVD